MKKYCCFCDACRDVEQCSQRGVSDSCKLKDIVGTEVSKVLVSKYDENQRRVQVAQEKDSTRRSNAIAFLKDHRILEEDTDGNMTRSEGALDVNWCSALNSRSATVEKLKDISVFADLVVRRQEGKPRKEDYIRALSEDGILTLILSNIIQHS